MGYGMRRRITRRNSGMLLAGAAAAVLAACGEPTVRYVGQPQAGPAGPAGPQGPKGESGAQGSQGAQGAAGAAAKAPVPVVFYQGLPETHPSGAARLRALEIYNETMGPDQGIYVDLSNSTASAPNKGGNNVDKIKTMVAAGAPPDMYVLAYRISQEFYVTGATVDFDQELKADPRWAAQRADIFPHMLESSMWTGKVVGMPVSTNNVAFIYNVGLLQQHGVEAPKEDWTLDNFEEKAQKFVTPPRENALDGLIPLSMGWYFYLDFVRSAGKNPISNDATKMQVDTSEFLETMELWLRWLDNRIIFDHPDEKQVWGVREEYRHAKNNVAFEHQGVYRIPTMRQQQAPPFEVVHVPLHPVKKVKSAINGGWNAVVFKTTAERQQAASQVTLWLSEPDAQVEHMTRAITIPISQKGLDHPKLREALKDDPQFRGFVDLAPYGWRWPGLPSYSKITGRIGTAVQDIMKKKVAPKAGLESAQRETQVMLDDDIKMMQ